MKDTQGNIVEIISGKYEKSKAVAYYNDQTNKTLELGKVVIRLMDENYMVSENKILKSADSLKIIGKCD